MAETILVTSELLREAAWFAGVAVVLAVLAFAAPAPRRRGLLPLALLAAAMVGGLWLVWRWGSVLGTGSAFVALRHPDRFSAASPLCGYHSYFVRRDGHYGQEPGERDAPQPQQPDRERGRDERREDPLEEVAHG